ncbi:Snf7 family [Cladochytrium replicatum]|nr:Snf7 family [Cladochytrium replicatum]
MNRIFGTANPKPKATLNDAITSTDARVDSVEVKIKKLEAEMIRFREQMSKMREGPAKACSAALEGALFAGGEFFLKYWFKYADFGTYEQNAVKQRALRVLKQKKMYEGQRDALAQQTFNMEQAQFATENLKNTMVTVDAMKMANKELKSQYKKISIDKIERMQDEMEDLLEQANEVQEAIGRTYGLPDDVDEEDLAAELDALGDELLEEEETPSYLQDTFEAPSVMPGRFEENKPQLESALRM